MAELKTPEEWLATPRFSKIEIVDPKGWDSQTVEWTQPITATEFQKRAMLSTVRIKPKANAGVGKGHRRYRKEAVEIVPSAEGTMGERWYVVVHYPEVIISDDRPDAQRVKAAPVRLARWAIVANADSKEGGDIKLQTFLTGRALYPPDRTYILSESAVAISWPTLLRRYKDGSLEDVV